MEENLIEAVKTLPCLFEKSSVVFRNKYLKDRAWQAVVTSVGVHIRGAMQNKMEIVACPICARKSMQLDEVVSRCGREERVVLYGVNGIFNEKHVTPKKTSSNFQFNCEESSSSQTPLTPLNDLVVEEYLEAGGSSHSQFSDEATTSGRSAKRQRIGNETRERFDQLCGTIEAVLAAKTKEVKPEEVQDRLKIGQVEASGICS